MPKLKPSAISAAADIVQKNITARGAYFGVRTTREFGKLFGMPHTTYNYLKNNPRSWTLEKLTIVAMALKVPLSWLMTDHSGEIKEDTQ